MTPYSYIGDIHAFYKTYYPDKAHNVDTHRLFLPKGYAYLVTCFLQPLYLCVNSDRTEEKIDNQNKSAAAAAAASPQNEESDQKELDTEMRDASAATAQNQETDTEMPDAQTIGYLDYINAEIGKANEDERKFWKGWFEAIQATRPRHPVLYLFTHIYPVSYMYRLFLFIDEWVVYALVDIQGAARCVGNPHRGPQFRSYESIITLSEGRGIGLL